MAQGFSLDTEQLGALPVINHFLGRLGVTRLLDAFVPGDDARLKLAPATALGVVVRNLVIHRRPVYALGEWAAPMTLRCWDWRQAKASCSTTTGSDGCWPDCSTPTGRAY